MVFKVSHSKLQCMMSCMCQSWPAISFRLEQLLREEIKSSLVRRDAGFEAAMGNFLECGHYLKSCTAGL